jgi:serine/threonine-protein kinase
MDVLPLLNASLAGRYLIERQIGQGGMATVYLARDGSTTAPSRSRSSPDLGAVVGKDRFLAEIGVTARLQHPHLLPHFDSGEADGQLFYVMPYVQGESLRDRLQREKQLPIDEAVRIAATVALALAYAHRHGVIHRDLKRDCEVTLHGSFSERT